jgi:hypothetical protein
MRDFSHLAMETSVLVPLAFAVLMLLDRVTPASSKRLTERTAHMETNTFSEKAYFPYFVPC